MIGCVRVFRITAREKFGLARANDGDDDCADLEGSASASSHN